MTTRRLVVAMTLTAGTLLWASVGPVQGSEGQFTAGSQWWSQTAKESKFQEFREVPRGGFLENFLWREWSGRNSVTLWGANGLRSDQAAKLTYANGARFRVDLGYQEIPHLFSQVARSPYVQTSPGAWTLPDSLRAKNQNNSSQYTSTMRDLLNNSPNVPLEFGTNISSARVRLRPAKGWTFDAKGSMRERSGVKPYAMTFGFSTAMEVPEPIDQQMIDADVTASYQHNDFSMQASGGMSRFKNRISTLRVDNPKRLTDLNGGDGASVGALDLYPDNEVVRGSIALSYLMPRRTALAATLGIAQSTQDDAFLPPTNNSALPQSTLDSLPARSLDGKAVQMSADVRLTTSPVEGLRGAARFHLADYDNQTPERNFLGQAPYDQSWQRYIELRNHAWGNSNWLTGLDLDYDVARQLSIGGTVEYRAREHTHREIEKDHETVFGARARLRPTPAFHVDARFQHGNREFDDFNAEEYEGLRQGTSGGPYDTPAVLEQLGLRRFDVANRKQDKATAGVAYAMNERVDLSASYAYLKNDYPDSEFGLQSDLEHSVAGTGTFHVNDQFDLEGGYGFGRTESDQASRQSGTATPSTNPADNWGALLKDTDVYVSAGFAWWAQPEKVSITGDYTFSRHLAEFDLSNGTNTAVDLPGTIYRLHDVMLEASYRWLARTTLSLRYGFEEYDVDDWATNDVPLIFPVTGTANSLFLGNAREGYRAHRIALLVRHRF